MPQGLPFHLNDYLELVDWSGRILRDDKKGAIADNLPGILQRLDMDPKQLPTSPKTSNTRSKTWSVRRIMCARHVSQLA